MYLKSIEIHGFKSFCNKIKFEFPDGITGIVGPNGSGKSNVADAVRWVLGEQKVKQLRSTKMEDVIFAGTAQRKPMGYAYVAITLDNSDHKLKLDYDEVTVSRRVYRSGESEYMLNGTLCRLRDVQELFYDTGIGKEGYSIIGQGQIDKILQGKPEERRELFDEAAGIVKYKKRKTIALRKLENERLNLARINDILSELGRQVGPLKRQSEAATKFIAFKDEMKSLDINLFLMENGELKDKIKSYKDKEEIAAADLDKARQDFEAMKEGYEKLSGELLEIEGEIEQVRNKIAQAGIVKESLQGQINVLNEQINSARESKGHYAERLSALSASIERGEGEKARLESEKKANQEALTRAISEASAQDSKVLDIQNRSEEAGRRAEELKERMIELVNKKGDIHARIERLLALSEQMQSRRAELAESLEKFANDKELQAAAVRELEKEKEAAEADVKSLEDEIKEKEGLLRQADVDVANAERELGRAKENLLKNETILDSLKNLTERYEGYGGSVKEIMKLKEKNQGIHGVVADIIKVDKKYEVAIETALGGNIQNIVTDTESTAKEVIEYLKANKLGRATFLPIKAVTGRGEFKNEEVLDEKGVLGVASSLVNVESRYTGVANYLLGKIIVADTIDNALRIARKYNYSLIIVTLEGELLNRGGSLTGGAFKNKSNLLGRRREIEDLEKSIEENRKIQEDSRKKSELAGKQKELIGGQLIELRAELGESRITLNTVRINLDKAREKQGEIENTFASADSERAGLAEKEDSMSSENEELTQSLEDNANEAEDLKALIGQMSGEMEKLKAQEAEELLKRQNLSAERSGFEGQNSVIVNSLVKTENELAILRNELDKIKKASEENEGDEAARLAEIESIKGSIALADESLQEMQVNLKSLEEKKEEQSGSHKDFLEKRESEASRIAELDKEVFRLSQLREKLEERFETKSAYIWDEYELTYNSALPLRDESLNDTKVMRDRIVELKNSIRSLGTINVAAIEEYKEVKERYEFMTVQAGDLMDAEADLVKIIKDLDKNMRKQFNQEFKKIQAEFGKVFREMFGGGEGRIELEEDVDVLDAGISIIAQPPGKKLQNMMQLSGGEKALTAIAVLFAIQNLKPSPFCILDEIEAALDDSNIGRFAGYVHRLVDETQFIIITHRKGTMEAADRLYGITMQEKGVSTLISVNLEEYEEEQLQ